MQNDDPNAQPKTLAEQLILAGIDVPLSAHAKAQVARARAAADKATRAAELSPNDAKKPAPASDQRAFAVGLRKRASPIRISPRTELDGERTGGSRL